MPLEKSASYWADLVHADHPHKPLPANTGQQKGTLTKRQRGSRLDAKNTPQGVIIASEFTAGHIPQIESTRGRKPLDVRLAGRTAMITGFSKGLGLAMAKEFAASGANVAIPARGPESLAKA